MPAIFETMYLCVRHAAFPFLEEVPVDAAPYPLAPAVSRDSKGAAVAARGPRTNASSRQQDAPPASASNMPPPPPPGAGSEDSLAPTASAPASSAAAPRAVPLSPPELRFETFNGDIRILQRRK